MTKAREPHFCNHGNRLEYTKALGASEGVQKARKPLRKGKGFAASKAQREKVKSQSCVVCGRDRYEATIDPAHVWSRGRGGCDHILCVIALCREHHNAYDEHALDLLPHLLNHGLFEEMAHPIRAHGISPLTLLERLTGQRYEPCPNAYRSEAA